MNRRYLSRLPTLLLALVLPFALVACGNKGPLVLADAPTADAPVGKAAAAPAAEVPAEADAAPPTDAASEVPADAPQPPPNRDR
jgi:predicted small lipoprotein YifL